MNLAIRRATYQDIDVCTRINYEITGGLIENPLFRVYWCDGYFLSLRLRTCEIKSALNNLSPLVTSKQGRIVAHTDLRGVYFRSQHR